MDNSILALDRAFINYFKHNAKEPKFKSKHSSRKLYTTCFTNNNIEVNYELNKIKLPKLKWVKVKCHRKINGRILNATISYTSSNKYYVSICYEVEDYIPLPRTRNVIGLNLGLTDFLVDSTGNHIKNIKVLKQYKDKITMYQRRLSK